ncbi:uncharacterized protein BDR25DRAFT_132345 [Lindgomyces ingoldianus]|uniref:Uncharacterized protein n=1 Tax=Lindgomyces ingoldianus TaxID=673940 RepID=A0ACB6R2J2_9PLEO|nr:uncharacterized protein BDR25DRAFT_132345 [Lindgomyces ingoldianus]KAF2473474.1 hypothetical protein BDR25DRAFT_132345 [Lindgomyces ingoldianus]
MDNHRLVLLWGLPTSFVNLPLIHPFTLTSIPLPPSMPMDDLRRSLPNSPYDMDPRDPRNMSAPFDNYRMSLDGPDYFGAMGVGPYRSRSQPGGPFPPPRLDSDMMMKHDQQQIDDLVRRTNLMVQFVNGHITHAGRYCQLQPKMCSDAKFPTEFRVPRTVEEVKVMDPSTLDRILRAYGLPTDLRSLRMTSQDTVSPRTAHQAKLCTLFDFLGATQISERQRMRHTPCLSY